MSKFFDPAKGWQLDSEVLEAIVGNKIDFNYVTKFQLNADLSDVASVTLTMQLTQEQIKRLHEIIKAGKASP